MIVRLTELAVPKADEANQSVVLILDALRGGRSWLPSARLVNWTVYLGALAWLAIAFGIGYGRAPLARVEFADEEAVAGRQCLSLTRLGASTSFCQS